jgi:hypothetical protein
MNKRTGITLLLSLSWAIGLIAVFSFPPTIKLEQNDSFRDSVLNEISAPNFYLRSTSENLEVPPYKLNWSLSFRLGPNWISKSTGDYIQFLAPSFFQKSKALSNVFDFFITFFYSW